MQCGMRLQTGLNGGRNFRTIQAGIAKNVGTKFEIAKTEVRDVGSGIPFQTPVIIMYELRSAMFLIKTSRI